MEQNNKKDTGDQSLQAASSEPERNSRKPSRSNGQSGVKPSGNPDRPAPQGMCTEKKSEESKNTEHPAHQAAREMVARLRAQGVKVITEPRKGLTVMFNPPQSWIDSFREQKEKYGI